MSEPIAVTLKSNRLGLGHAQSKSEPIASQPKVDLDKFRSHIHERQSMKEIQMTMDKVRWVIQNLDEKKEIPAHDLWPKTEPETVLEREIADESMSPEEQLLTLLHYLRATHCYCYYCGCSFEDEADMLGYCPGVLKADHDEFIG